MDLILEEVHSACVVAVFSCRCVEMVKSSQYVKLANDLEINKAITFLRQKDFNQVTVCLLLRLDSSLSSSGRCLSPRRQRRRSRYKLTSSR